MKIAGRPSSPKRKIKLDSRVFSLSEAMGHLGRLMEKASHGEPVYIIRGRRRFVLPEVPEIEPIPLRPPGFFASASSPADIQEDNILAKVSVIRAPRDLE